MSIVIDRAAAAKDAVQHDRASDTAFVDNERNESEESCDVEMSPAPDAESKMSSASSPTEHNALSPSSQAISQGMFR